MSDDSLYLFSSWYNESEQFVIVVLLVVFMFNQYVNVHIKEQVYKLLGALIVFPFSVASSFFSLLGENLHFWQLGFLTSNLVSPIMSLHLLLYPHPLLSSCISWLFVKWLHACTGEFWIIAGEAVTFSWPFLLTNPSSLWFFTLWLYRSLVLPNAKSSFLQLQKHIPKPFWRFLLWCHSPLLSLLSHYFLNIIRPLRLLMVNSGTICFSLNHF